MQRPILIVLIGYIIGIMLGLYCKISIVLFILLILVIYLFIKKFVHINKNILRYYKQFEIKTICIIIFISAILSNTIALIQNYNYENKYKGFEEGKIIATVVSDAKVKKYYTQYKIKIENINNNKKYNNTYLYLNLKEDKNLKYGDKILFSGTFIQPEIQRNYKGFNYKEYLKSIGIYGSVKTDKVEVIGKGKVNILNLLANNTASKIKEIIRNNMPNEDRRNLLLGILLGYDDELDNKLKESFQDSSLSHILAVSGMHVSYIVSIITFLSNKMNVHKKVSKIIIISFLIFFIFLTGGTPSVKRACIMSILTLIGSLIYRKSDIITNISTSLLIILIQNPFSILDIGLLLSFFATMGIIVFYKNIMGILNKKQSEKNNQIKQINKKEVLSKIVTKIKEGVGLSVSAQILILPLSLVLFNKLSLTFLFSNLLISFIIGLITILGFISVIIPLNILFLILDILLKLLISIADIFSSMWISKIVITTPNIIYVILYYIFILFIVLINFIRKKQQKRRIEKLILTFVDNFKCGLKSNKKKLLAMIIILIMLFNFAKFIPKNLQIYFIDVGQGDSTLIVTPNKKTILIDGGGSKSLDEFDVGKNTLLPYLLDRKISKIEYLMISHFDSDHCNGLIAVLENLKVEKVIISKQIEICDEYKRIIEVIKKKNIKILIVKAGDKIVVDENVRLDILYPEEKLQHTDINNNSIVVKLSYNNFSMLFTGDIEEEAEKKIIEKYRDTNKLKSTIIKIAHHGSKTSSSDEFIRMVKPQIALIGVGKNNLFGHPSNQVIDRLNNSKTRICRTDLNGEIIIKVNKKGKIKVDKKID